jgi:hypothetical protein
MLIALAAIVTLSTISVQAATRQKKNDRKRDGSGETCKIQGSQTRRGGGNGSGDRKRDGSGDRKRDGSGGNCKLLGDQMRQSCGADNDTCLCGQEQQGCGANGGNCTGKGSCGDL